MKTIIIILLTMVISLPSFQQEQFIDFLKSDNLPNCLKGLNDDELDRLMTQHEIQARNTTFRLDYDNLSEVLYLTTSSHCDDIQKVHLKYLKKDEKDYVFMYKERVPHSDSYGRLRVYNYEAEDSSWVQGRKVEITWEQLFNLNEKDLKRLKDVDQFPKYIIRFEENDIVFDIPWRLYTFEEGSVTDGYTMSRGKKEARMPYRYFLL